MSDHSPSPCPESPDSLTGAPRAQWRIIAAAIAIAGGALIAWGPGGGDPVVRGGLAMLFLVAVLWLSEALPVSVTALLIPLLAGFGGVLTTQDALAGFADPLIFLFLGGFVLAGALQHHGVDRFVSESLRRTARGSFTGAAVLLMLATALISMWMSNTAATAVMLPLAAALVKNAHLPPGRERQRAQLFLLLGVAYAASIGGMGTVVGTPPNGITARALHLDFIGWLRFGIPAVLLLMPALFGLLWIVYRPRREWRVSAPATEGTGFAWTLPRIAVISILGLTALAWLCGRPISQWTGVTKGVDSLIAVAAVVALTGTGLVPWKAAMNSIDWGTLLLFGGGLTLSRVLEATKASDFVAHAFSAGAAGWPAWCIIPLLILTVILLSEFGSNTAIAALMVPLFGTVATQMHGSPESLVLPVGLAASCGFMLPVATPPNAIVYGTGLIPSREMLKTGLLLDLICVAVLTVLVKWVY